MNKIFESYNERIGRIDEAAGNSYSKDWEAALTKAFKGDVTTTNSKKIKNPYGGASYMTVSYSVTTPDNSYSESIEIVGMQINGMIADASVLIKDKRGFVMIHANLGVDYAVRTQLDNHIASVIEAVILKIPKI